jgi:hypothetical protein
VNETCIIISTKVLFHYEICVCENMVKVENVEVYIEAYNTREIHSMTPNL